MVCCGNMTESIKDTVFEKIKNQNGEKVAQLLQNENLLGVPDIVHVLEFAGNNSRCVQYLVPRLRGLSRPVEIPNENIGKNPLELLSDAGYDAFVVETEEQKNSIRKYFRKSEALCTFDDPVRHKNNYVIHAVKRGANKIKPAAKPGRQDEYGTSVISIQISKQNKRISITNRYNHRVENAMSTFDNEPDNIIPGLTNALKNFFGINFVVGVQHYINDRFCEINHQFVRYWVSFNNVYFGTDYYVQNNKIVKLNNEEQILLDYFVLNLKTGDLTNIANINDSGYDILKGVFANKKIEIKQNSQNPEEKYVCADGKRIVSVEKGRIRGIWLDDVKEIGDNFLYWAKSVNTISLPDTEIIGKNFVYHGRYVNSVYVPKLKIIDDYFLSECCNLVCFDGPWLEEVGDGFLENDTDLITLLTPKLKIAGNYFVYDAVRLKNIDISSLQKVGCMGLARNRALEIFCAPCLVYVGDLFMSDNKNAKVLEAPSLETTGDGFLSNNDGVQIVYTPALRKTGFGFMQKNTKIKKIYAPVLCGCGEGFCASTKEYLMEFDANTLKQYDFDTWNRLQSICNQNIARKHRLHYMAKLHALGHRSL